MLYSVCNQPIPPSSSFKKRPVATAGGSFPVFWQANSLFHVWFGAYRVLSFLHRPVPDRRILILSDIVVFPVQGSRPIPRKTYRPASVNRYYRKKAQRASLIDGCSSAAVRPELACAPKLCARTYCTIRRIPHESILLFRQKAVLSSSTGSSSVFFRAWTSSFHRFYRFLLSSRRIRPPLCKPVDCRRIQKPAS